MSDKNTSQIDTSDSKAKVNSASDYQQMAGSLS